MANVDPSRIADGASAERRRGRLAQEKKAEEADVIRRRHARCADRLWNYAENLAKTSIASNSSDRVSVSSAFVSRRPRLWPLVAGARC